MAGAVAVEDAVKETTAAMAIEPPIAAINLSELKEFGFTMSHIARCWDANFKKARYGRCKICDNKIRIADYLVKYMFRKKDQYFKKKKLPPVFFILTEPAPIIKKLFTPATYRITSAHNTVEDDEDIDDNMTASASASASASAPKRSKMCRTDEELALQMDILGNISENMTVKAKAELLRPVCFQCYYFSRAFNEYSFKDSVPLQINKQYNDLSEEEKKKYDKKHIEHIIEWYKLPTNAYCIHTTYSAGGITICGKTRPRMPPAEEREWLPTINDYKCLAHRGLIDS